MAKSNAQRQREWREKQKAYNLEEYRKKELHRVKKYKEKQNVHTRKQKQRDATRRWRENKKATLTPEIQSPGKALKKVNKSLPQSPRKKVAVVKALAKSFQLVTEKKKTGLEIPQETKELVKAFYRREDISRFMPGKQDVVTLLDDDGNKYKEQKRILQFV